MQIENKAIYLPIRSFGDFIISASVIKNCCNLKVPIVLPYYLKEVYKAIDGDSIFDLVADISFDNQPAYFEMYKVKNLKNVIRLLKDINITSKLDSSKSYLLDFKSRRLFFLNKNLLWPSDSENIYQAKYDLFNKYFSLKKENFCSIPLSSSKYKNIIIFPESRVKSKEISEKLIFDITAKFRHSTINIARYSPNQQSSISEKNLRYYSNFDQLIKLVNSHDLIISAESLPYHLAFFYNKPHFVIYKPTKHFKATFMTEFMIRSDFYITFDGSNTAVVLDKLELIIA